MNTPGGRGVGNITYAKSKKVVLIRIIESKVLKGGGERLFVSPLPVSILGLNARAFAREIVFA